MAINLKDMGDRFVKFLREARAELRKVIWPNRQQTAVFTSVVVISVAVVAAMIWIVDFAVSEILALIIRS